ncbi:MAG: sensor histidine kinase [Sideroxyarcus sp.]|nr:sensor histidine kinase [Sideroxyarcus sp.]
MNIALMRQAREHEQAVGTKTRQDMLKGMSGAVPCARPVNGDRPWSVPNTEKTESLWSVPYVDSRWMANELLSIQENERRRIAADLHDGLGQSLTMIKFALAESMRLLSSGAISEASNSLQELKLKAHEALEEMRHVIMDLRPPMLDDLGILPTLNWYFRELETVCPTLKVEKDFGVTESTIPDSLKVTIFRIVQEASSNTIKYANAGLIRVSLTQTGDTLKFSIEDNGDGFDFSRIVPRNGSGRGLGLLSMKERASLSGGKCVMESVPGKGTCIGVSWELSKLSGH